MEKYRNLDYLEHESQKHRKNEEERKEEQERRLKKMRERLLKEEVDLLRGGRGGDGDDDTGRVAKNGISNSRNSGYVHCVVLYCIILCIKSYFLQLRKHVFVSATQSVSLPLFVSMSPTEMGEEIIVFFLFSLILVGSVAFF